MVALHTWVAEAHMVRVGNSPGVGSSQEAGNSQEVARIPLAGLHRMVAVHQRVSGVVDWDHYA